jgi:hypothetical protein
MRERGMLEMTWLRCGRRLKSSKGFGVVELYSLASEMLSGESTNSGLLDGMTNPSSTSSYNVDLLYLFTLTSLPYSTPASPTWSPHPTQHTHGTSFKPSFTARNKCTSYHGISRDSRTIGSLRQSLVDRSVRMTSICLEQYSNYPLNV